MNFISHDEEFFFIFPNSSAFDRQETQNEKYTLIRVITLT